MIRITDNTLSVEGRSARPAETWGQETSRPLAALDRPVSVVITVDTEPDDAFTNHLNPSVANVYEMPRFQALLDRYGAKATYLVSYLVIQDDRARDVLRRLVEEGGAEVGAHLHPWENPPFLPSGQDVRYPTYPHELPPEIFEQKLDCLTEVITRRLSRPTSYRAGRWGFAPSHIGPLQNMGYRVDTSVTPGIDWRAYAGIPCHENGCGGIDYRRAPRHPYYLDYADVRTEGSARLLELPLTGSFTRRAPGFAWRAFGNLPLPMKRVLRKTGVLRPVWAVPPRHNRKDLLQMLSTRLAEGDTWINIALHSSQLVEGSSPQTRTRAQTDEVFARVEALLLALVAQGNCVFDTLTGAADRWCGERERTPRRPVHMASFLR